MQNHLNFIHYIIDKKGPDPVDYPLFKQWADGVALELEKGLLTKEDLKSIRATFGDVLTDKTMHGFTLVKPYGYAGDFEIIDKIYQNYVTDNAYYEKWDKYFQSLSASVAVRNRKSYFHSLLQKHAESNEILNVLNVASGPARDLLEFFESGYKNVYVDCVEYDSKAVTFASELCKDYLSFIKFHRANAFRFNTEKKYQLIWSAGLFDYFDDERFKFLLKRLQTFLAPNGELVIGNFSPENPDRSNMEVVGEWVLQHRNAARLISLAKESGARKDTIFIGKESQGVNLFLHIKNQN